MLRTPGFIRILARSVCTGNFQISEKILKLDITIVVPKRMLLVQCCFVTRGTNNKLSNSLEFRSRLFTRNELRCEEFRIEFEEFIDWFTKTCYSFVQKIFFLFCTTYFMRYITKKTYIQWNI